MGVWRHGCLEVWVCGGMRVWRHWGVESMGVVVENLRKKHQAS